jgi:hypothetical protein
MMSPGAANLAKVSHRRGIRNKDFVSSLNMLLGECDSVTANSRDFDRFLWIVGSWMHFQKSHQVNGELKYLFEKRPKSLAHCFRSRCTLAAPLRGTNSLNETLGR